jgi:hypothetical protein
VMVPVGRADTVALLSWCRPCIAPYRPAEDPAARYGSGSAVQTPDHQLRTGGLRRNAVVPGQVPLLPRHVNGAPCRLYGDPLPR